MDLLEITNQPCDVFRFRYESEKVGHGKLRSSLPDEPNNKKTNFPTVKLKFPDRYASNERVQIKASLYTIENPPRPHIVQLIGRNCNENGECLETVSKDGIAVFRGLEVRTKTKPEVIQMLVDKKKEILELAGEQYDIETIQKEATDECKSLDMDYAVLCFEAFHKGRSISKKVFSSPILDQKAAPSDLRIIRISHYAGSWEGGDEVILLCAKFKKADNDKIEIQFFEEDENDEIIWSGKGSFDPADDIHYQNAIVFRTPKYRDISGGKVKMKLLYRTSDKQRSDPVPFEYIPGEIDSFLSSKKRKLVQYSEPMENGFAPTCSGVERLSPVSLMEDDSNLIASPQIEVNGNYPTFPDFEIIASQEFVVSTSGKIESPQLDVSGNNPTLFESSVGQEVLATNSYLTERTQEVRTERALSDDDSSIDEDLDDILDKLEWEYSMYNSHPNTLSQPPSQLEDLDNNEQSSNIMTDAAVPNLYLEDEHIRNMKEKASSGLKNGIEKMTLYKEPYGARTTKTSGHIYGTTKTSLKPSQEVLGESGLCSSMKQLSIDKEMVDKHNINTELPVSVDAPSSKKENLEENASSKSKVEVIKNFEHFKEGVNRIMKNRREHVYLQYISKLMTVEDEDGNTFLHLAIKEQNENVNLIAMILRICPEFVNKQNKYKETPLHLATKTNAYKVVLRLLLNGGNSSIVDDKGNNCFHIASKFNFTNCMKILLLSSLKYGRPMPSINERNYEGWAPLHLSVLNNSGECLKLLLRAQANVNIKDGKSGSSVLILALKHQPALLHSLLHHPGIDLLNQNFKGAFVKILSTMKGEPIPKFNDSEHLVNWAFKTLDLPTIDSCECTSSSSDTSCSYEDSDEDERDIVQTPIVNNVEQNSLNKECEEQLCRYLDTSSHWRKLGTSIGIEEKTLNGLELLSKTSSPSKVILRNVKNLYPNCNKQTLINVLIEADLEEAVKLLNQ